MNDTGIVDDISAYQVGLLDAINSRRSLAAVLHAADRMDWLQWYLEGWMEGTIILLVDE
jgi:hypothetical protein